MDKLAKQVVFSGIQPSGFIHLGNYLGAVQNWVHLQNYPDHQDSLDRFYCIVDYHAITQKYVGQHIQDEEFDPGDAVALANSRFRVEEQVQELSLKTAATLLACGIDPDKSTLFVQSNVPAHTEMMWFLSTMTPLSWLNKMIQFKEKKAKSDKHSSLSLYSYPVLMSADIMLYQANLVPVGEDQTQHLELCKDICGRFNRLFGQMFPLPENMRLTEDDNYRSCKRVMSLQNGNKKMSKSDVSKLACINLIDDPEIIRQKVRKAKTDSLGTVTYQPDERPEVSNLLRIYAALEGIDVRKAPGLFADDNMFSFKEKLSNKLIDKICPIGERALNLCDKEEGRLLEVVDTGAQRANKVAEETLKQLKERVGLLRRN